MPPEADDDGALPDEPGLSDKDFDAFFPEENYVEDLLADPDADSDDESRGSELRRLRAIAGPSNADKAATTTPPVPLSPQASRADIPIAQRTRAHVSLEDVQLEELEAILSTAPIDEPLLNFGVDDSAEYERFLQTLQTMPLDQGFHTDTEAEGEDSEDEDFLNELERMLEEEAAAMGIGAEALQDLDIPWLEDGADNVGRKRRRNDGSGLVRIA